MLEKVNVFNFRSPELPLSWQDWRVTLVAALPLFVIMETAKRVRAARSAG